MLLDVLRSVLLQGRDVDPVRYRGLILPAAHDRYDRLHCGERHAQLSALHVLERTKVPQLGQAGSV